ncbi:MAG: DUF1488 family protein [Burkholderiaceae bacterium]|jgi:hypothetical protein
MNRIGFDYPRSRLGVPVPMDAYVDRQGVRFPVELGADTFDCLVAGSTLQALDVYGVLHDGMLSVYRKHQNRIHAKANRLVEMGLRGSRLVLYPHHFMDA